MKVNRQVWTIEELAQAISLYHQQWSAGDIARTIGRTIEATRRKLRDHGYTFLASIDKAEQGRLAAQKVTKNSNTPDLYRRLSAAEANILHLIDLKRAGHSASKTEYRIAPEYARFVGVSFFSGSGIGSVAQLCADA